MPELTVIADHGDLCGEGPIWDPEAGALCWTDCVGLKFYCYDWVSGRSRIVKEGLEICGCALSLQGGFVITNTSGVWLWDGYHKIELIAAEVDGFRCQRNDCIVDPAGRLFAGSCFYDPAKQYLLGQLIRVDTDGTGPHRG